MCFLWIGCEKCAIRSSEEKNVNGKEQIIYVLPLHKLYFKHRLCHYMTFITS
jgi:hypothetical protein